MNDRKFAGNSSSSGDQQLDEFQAGQRPKEWPVFASCWHQLNRQNFGSARGYSDRAAFLRGLFDNLYEVSGDPYQAALPLNDPYFDLGR